MPKTDSKKALKKTSKKTSKKNRVGVPGHTVVSFLEVFGAPFKFVATRCHGGYCHATGGFVATPIMRGRRKRACAPVYAAADASAVMRLDSDEAAHSQGPTRLVRLGSCSCS